MRPVIDQVKAGAMGFHDQLLSVMAAKDKYVSSLRLRVVAYRDYYDSPSDALFQTPFFRLPDERFHFDSFVQTLGAAGGGDEPESALEALSVAMLSPWERGLDRRRHVIVLFTDASAHPLEAAFGREPAGYPTSIPRSFDAITDLWDDPQGVAMEFASKRLLLYAPDVYPWNIISSNWDNVLHYPSAAGRGLNERPEPAPRNDPPLRPPGPQRTPPPRADRGSLQPGQTMRAAPRRHRRQVPAVCARATSTDQRRRAFRRARR
jgi:hypothetical protein